MSRFAVPNAPRVPATSPTSLGPTAVPGLTREGGAGFVDGDPRVELFNAAVSGLLADGFYETGGERLERLVRLTGDACTVDPGWVRAFAPWARAEANLRSAPLVVALEYAALGLPGSRQLVDAVCQRADEPGEALAYWHTYHGRRVPSRVKRGLADAVARLYTERAASRYDGQAKGYRFGDVLELVHPTPRDERQSVLFKHLLDRRRHPREPVPTELKATLQLRAFASLDPAQRASWRDQCRPGSSWRLPDLLSWEWLGAQTPGGLDAPWWDALLVGGQLKGLALLRNLNNLDRAGAARDGLAHETVVRQLSDPAEVAQARLLPYRFLTAYLASESGRWAGALEEGASAALANLPTFGGRTLIAVDGSGSMQSPVGAGKSRQPLQLSRLAGFVAETLARRCQEAAIVVYGTSVREVLGVQTHVGVLRASERREYSPSGGTETWRCLAEAWNRSPNKPDRVFVLTDEQTRGRDDGTVACPVVTWNLAGYGQHQALHGSARRYLVAGYSDTALQTLPAVIAHGSTGRWPWET